MVGRQFTHSRMAAQTRWTGLAATVLRGADAATLACDTAGCQGDAACCQVQIRMDRLAV